MLSFRWQYLTIRQLARPRIVSLDLYWIHSSGGTNQAERSPLSSIVTNLVNDFSAL